ncbi:MAG: PAS domain S-box protein [Chitinispirillaceae bacterium]|nr:PAS domain S-box protein [Chitinispirillaceae bacterium]
MAPLTLQYFTITFIALIVFITIGFTFFLRWIFLKSTLPRGRFNLFPQAVIITTALSMVIMVSGYITTERLLENEEGRIGRQTHLTVSMVKTLIEGSISRIDAGAATIAGSPWLVDALKNPVPDNIGKANTVLDRYRRTFGAAVVYLLDASGLTIASSNRDDRDSFVGNNYSFRPYFTGAVRGAPVSYFAVGVTSGKRGYYRSTPVIDSSTGSVLGVAVIKNSLCELDSVFASVPDAFLIDHRNMIFLASDTLLQGRLFCVGEETVTSEIELKTQFGWYSLEPVLSECAVSGSIIRYKRENYLFVRTGLLVADWSIVLISSLVSLQRYYLLGLSVTVVFLLIVLVVFSLILLHQVKVWVESVFLSEKRFRTIFDTAPETIVIIETVSGIIAAANPQAIALVRQGIGKVTVSEVLGADGGSSAAFTLPLTPEKVCGVFRLTADGGVRSLSVSSAPLQYKRKKCIVSFWRDISEIIETQHALAASERQYRELTELLPEGVFEVNANGTFSYANRRALDMFGYTAEDLSGKVSPADVVIAEDATRAMSNIRRVMLEHSQGHHEYIARNTDGKTFPVLVHSTVMLREDTVCGICGVVIDLTERKRIEYELQKTEKLEALGILAGGIAHDFNNLLTAIWSGFSMIRISIGNNPEIVGVVNEMENAIRRGKDLTAQLLTYSKGGAPVKSVTSLETLVRETSGFITTGTAVKCTIDSVPDLMPVDIDGTQISQVVQNLLINAIEAMPSGGIVSIQLKNRTIDDAQPGTVPPGRYIEMVVADTGSGIPQEVQTRIFDPFFTTKPEGSGLGLATTYSIVKKHNGHISLLSTEGKGTSFTILLPVTEKKEIPSGSARITMRNGSGRILVMDDEPTILTVTQKLLKMMGYSVTTACDGNEAVTRYREQKEKGEPFDVVILDLTVPAGLGGKETVRRILEIDSDAKAIVSSGYSNDPIMADYTSFGFKAVIAKPYNMQQLHSVVQSLLYPEETAT